MDELFEKLNQAGLIDAEDRIILAINEDGNIQAVTKDVFITFFKDVYDNPNYENLSGSHTFIWFEQEYTRTAEELGYQVYFDQWNEQGILI